MLSRAEREMLDAWLIGADFPMAPVVRRLIGERDQLLTIAEHLFQMVSPEVWRASGGDDGQGHYEGEYHAEQLREELQRMREAT